jgi:hypothetical protein
MYERTGAYCQYLNDSPVEGTNQLLHQLLCGALSDDDETYSKQSRPATPN